MFLCDDSSCYEFFNFLQMWEILPYCMAKAGVDIFTKCLSLGKIFLNTNNDLKTLIFPHSCITCNLYQFINTPPILKQVLNERLVVVFQLRFLYTQQLYQSIFHKKSVNKVLLKIRKILTFELYEFGIKFIFAHKFIFCMITSVFLSISQQIITNMLCCSFRIGTKGSESECDCVSTCSPLFVTLIERNVNTNSQPGSYFRVISQYSYSYSSLKQPLLPLDI